MDVKKLYTNVPLGDIIDIALESLYSQKDSPDLSRSTIKRLLYMAVSNGHFKCNDPTCVQKVGFASAASMAVILRNFWLKDYEKVLAIDNPQKINIPEDMNVKCPKCNARVTFETKAVECEDCLNWYHKDCGGISMRNTKAYQKIFGSANCARRGVNVS